MNGGEDRTNQMEKMFETGLLNGTVSFAAPGFGTGAIYGRVAQGNETPEKTLRKGGYQFLLEESGAEDDPCGNGMLIYRKEF